eukprot:s358_g14.t1
MLLPMCRRIVARRRSQASYFKLGTSSLPSSSFRAGWQAASAPRPPTKAPWDRFKTSAQPVATKQTNCSRGTISGTAIFDRDDSVVEMRHEHAVQHTLADVLNCDSGLKT